jgi:signal peptidase I
MAPEQITAHLDGLVYNHPRYPFEQGKPVSTSPIVGKRGDKVVTRSGTEYELGAVLADYEAQFPNAKERLLQSLKTV